MVDADVAPSADANRRDSLLNKIFWTAGTFGASFILKLGSNVVLSRLLAPEIFGVMVIVNSMRVGLELLSDVGIEQNIVSHKDGLQHDYFNTAWTIQILRGALLSGLFLLASPWLASFYGVDVRVFQVISLAPFLNGCASTSIFVMVKNMEVRRRNMFELRAEFLNFAICVTLAIITPTVWALVFGALLSVAARSALSYFIDHPPHRLMLHRGRALEIWHFGKWIMISSLVVYVSTNFDRLYLGGIAPLYLLGIYGIARTISDLPTILARRLSYQVIFPALAAAGASGSASTIAELRSTRVKFVLLAAAALGGGSALADIAIQVLFDPRYHEAGWMLSLLLIGAMFSVLSTLNEAMLLGAGRPAFTSATNILRFVVLALALPAGYYLVGFPGAIAAIILSEAARYVFVGIGQYRIRQTFWLQDAMAVVAALAVAALVVSIRMALHLGTPWSLLHLSLPAGF